MGKISKKYIGTDQVGSVQIELENALSLRAKTADGLSSVDLLEYSAADQLLVQQHLYIADDKNLISNCGSSDTFYIRSENSAAIVLFSNNLASGSSGNVALLSGNSDASGNTGMVNFNTGNAAAGDSGSINLTTGTASGNRGGISLNARFVENILPDSGSFVISSSGTVGTSQSRLSFGFDGFGQPNGEGVGVRIYDAGPNFAYVHECFSVQDQAAGSTIFTGCTPKSSVGGTITGGAFVIQAPASDAFFITGANAEVSSGQVTIETLNAYVKGTGANANSGNIVIQTGAKAGTGTRGSITLNALEVQCSAMQFKNAADPTLAQDLATKAYVDSQIASGTTCNKQSITLSAGDIAAQYVDLAEQYVPESLFVGVGQRVNLYESLDYTLSIVGGVTRLTFAGPSATGGAEELVDGDILYIQGIVDISP